MKFVKLSFICVLIFFHAHLAFAGRSGAVYDLFRRATDFVQELVSPSAKLVRHSLDDAGMMLRNVRFGGIDLVAEFGEAKHLPQVSGQTTSDLFQHIREMISIRKSSFSRINQTPAVFIEGSTPQGIDNLLTAVSQMIYREGSDVQLIKINLGDIKRTAQELAANSSGKRGSLSVEQEIRKLISEIFEITGRSDRTVLYFDEFESFFDGSNGRIFHDFTPEDFYALSQQHKVSFIAKAPIANSQALFDQFGTLAKRLNLQSIGDQGANLFHETLGSISDFHRITIPDALQLDAEKLIRLNYQSTPELGIRMHDVLNRSAIIAKEKFYTQPSGLQKLQDALDIANNKYRNLDLQVKSNPSLSNKPTFVEQLRKVNEEIQQITENQKTISETWDTITNSRFNQGDFQKFISDNRLQRYFPNSSLSVQDELKRIDALLSQSEQGLSTQQIEALHFRSSQLKEQIIMVRKDLSDQGFDDYYGEIDLFSLAEAIKRDFPNRSVDEILEVLNIKETVRAYRDFLDQNIGGNKFMKDRLAIHFEDQLRGPQNRPKIYFLAGHSGTGKTETAITNSFAKSGKEPIKWDGSRFVTEHDYSIMTGSSPGLVGMGVTDATRLVDNPKISIIIDEVEKGDHQLLTKLLAWADDGYIPLTVLGSDGKTAKTIQVPLGQADIFITSNSMREAMTDEVFAHFESITDPTRRLGELRKWILEQNPKSRVTNQPYLLPEIVNRMDDIFLLPKFNQDEMIEVMKVIINKKNKFLEELIDLKFTDEAFQALSRKSIELDNAAARDAITVWRDLERYIRQSLNGNLIEAGDKIEVSVRPITREAGGALRGSAEIAEKWEIILRVQTAIEGDYSELARLPL